jgi:hypothetical protein
MGKILTRLIANQRRQASATNGLCLIELSPSSQTLVTLSMVRNRSICSGLIFPVDILFHRRFVAIVFIADAILRPSAIDKPVLRAVNVRFWVEERTCLLPYSLIRIIIAAIKTNVKNNRVSPPFNSLKACLEELKTVSSSWTVVARLSPGRLVSSVLLCLNLSKLFVSICFQSASVKYICGLNIPETVWESKLTVLAVAIGTIFRGNVSVDS